MDSVESATLRLPTIALTTVLLTTSATTLRAMVVYDNGLRFQQKEKEKHREHRLVPEGSAAAISILALDALGGGILVDCRRENVSAGPDEIHVCAQARATTLRRSDRRRQAVQ